MLIDTGHNYIQKLRKLLDWKLLAFLLLFLNVKLAVKIPAIALIYILQFDFKFGFSLKNSRLPLFYPLMIVIGTINFIIGGRHDLSYVIVWLTGISFWLLCILAVHQVKLSVEKNDAEVISNTIIVFFVINALCSAFNLLSIIHEIHAINPYTYQGNYQKYFIGTGDYIKGITFDTSNTNAILNTIGVIYFLDKKKPFMVLICMAVMLLTCSNFMNIILLLILSGIFIFKSTRDQKSLIAACVVMLVVFMLKVSPQNNQYVINITKYVFLQEKPEQRSLITQTAEPVLSPDEQKQKIAQSYLDSVSRASIPKNRIIKPVFATTIPATKNGRIIIPGADINSAPYQSLTTTPVEQRPLAAFINTHKQVLPISGNDNYNSLTPGKVLGIVQTIGFMHHHASKIWMGAGMGNFSSKLAFRASGLGFSGGYPARYIYIYHDFLVNHLDLYLNFFSRRAGYHSLTNSPFSVYDQVASEYGLLGLLALILFYFGFFASRYQQLTYGIPLLLLMAAVFFVDYWFEQLSVIPFFELMLFLNISETNKLKPAIS
ncbi:hypothetical protein SAMN05216490_0536 [Mucilaginibacter mallensis]|uniref:O-Antigen ligase n=1 Tax=Mucilaginibacter mallensis TaxID=652787 RepID=A0A1H1PFA1_MUCMA|nr:hypothetical protein [Mucilaginibacter mallensis]SDS09783.1 hypothetical protein SAMN05216490_0536 [Mucilaginibacter mallensis]